MRRQPAKVLEPGDVRRLLEHVERFRYPQRDEVIVLLSFNAGLRACEIAGLDWDMVLTTNGKVSDTMMICRGIAKFGTNRRLPLNPQLKRALGKLHKALGKPASGPIIRSERDGHMTARSIVNWFGQRYGELGLTGCSSHSGRRTFITKAARVLARSGGSLRDVQELAGHRAITTTERYIEGDRDAQRKLVRLI